MVKKGVFIGCLPGDSKEAELLDLLKSFAKVTSIKLARGRNQTGPNFCQGYGFAMCETQQDVEILLALDGIRYRNRAIIIKAYKSGSVLKQEKGTLRERRIFFGNVFNSITEETLRPFFETFGNLEALYFVEQSKSMKFKYGYAVYLDATDAKKAVKGLVGLKICGNKLRIELAGNVNSSSKRKDLNNGDDGLPALSSDPVYIRAPTQPSRASQARSNRRTSTRKLPIEEPISSSKTTFSPSKSRANGPHTPTSITEMQYPYGLGSAEDMQVCAVERPVLIHNKDRTAHEGSHIKAKTQSRVLAYLDHSEANIRLNVIVGARRAF